MIRLLMLSLYCFLCLANCAGDGKFGYTSSTLYPTQFHSVHVPIFQNKTTTRNLEFMLTDALIKEIQARTPYRVTDEQTAETQLTGTITGVQMRSISKSRTTGLDNEVLFEVVIDFEWLDLSGGGRIVGKQHFASNSVFIPSRPSSEPIEVAQFAVVQQLASDIVDQMQASW